MIKARRLFLVPSIAALICFIPLGIFGLVPWLLILAGWYSKNSEEIEAYFKGKDYMKKEYSDREVLKWQIQPTHKNIQKINERRQKKNESKINSWRRGNIIVYLLTLSDECLNSECCGGKEDRPVKLTRLLSVAEEWSKQGYKYSYEQMTLPELYWICEYCQKKNYTEDVCSCSVGFASPEILKEEYAYMATWWI